MKFYTKLASLCALFFAFTAQAQFTHPMLFEVNSPSSIARSYTYGPQSGAGWGITALPSASVSGPLVWAYDNVGNDSFYVTQLQTLMLVRLYLSEEVLVTSV